MRYKGVFMFGVFLSYLQQQNWRPSALANEISIHLQYRNALDIHWKTNCFKPLCQHNCVLRSAALQLNFWQMWHDNQVHFFVWLQHCLELVRNAKWSSSVYTSRPTALWMCEYKQGASKPSIVLSLTRHSTITIQQVWNRNWKTLTQWELICKLTFRD